MSKSVCRNPEIILGGVDVSEWFVSMNWSYTVGTLNQADLTFVYDPEVFKIEAGAFPNGDRVTVQGVDISSWISRYDAINQCGLPPAHLLTLRVHLDPQALSINGTTPWVGTGLDFSTNEVRTAVKVV